MKLSLVAAHSLDRVIGVENRLPWRISEDLKRFKQLTLGHSVIMGRKTFESIGKPLPKRRNIVVSRTKADLGPGVEVVASVDEALRLVGAEDEAFVIGGGEIYAQTLERADRLYLTIVETHVPGDAFFPAYDLAAWRAVESVEGSRGDLPYGYRFVTLDRAASRERAGAATRT
jgi:dihydrofolate reductase